MIVNTLVVCFFAMNLMTASIEPIHVDADVSLLQTPTTQKNITTPINPHQIIPEYTKMVRDIASSQEFKVGIWDCSNISEKATKKLIEEGYNAFYCVGYFQQETLKQDSLHAWVIIRLNDSVIRLDPTKYPHTKGIPNEFYIKNYESVGCYNDRFPDRLKYKTEWMHS